MLHVFVHDPLHPSREQLTCFWSFLPLLLHLYYLYLLLLYRSHWVALSLQTGSLVLPNVTTGNPHVSHSSKQVRVGRDPTSDPWRREVMLDHDAPLFSSISIFARFQTPGILFYAVNSRFMNSFVKIESIKYFCQDQIKNFHKFPNNQCAVCISLLDNFLKLVKIESNFLLLTRKPSCSCFMQI